MMPTHTAPKLTLDETADALHRNGVTPSRLSREAIRKIEVEAMAKLVDGLLPLAIDVIGESAIEGGARWSRKIARREESNRRSNQFAKSRRNRRRAATDDGAVPSNPAGPVANVARAAGACGRCGKNRGGVA